MNETIHTNETIHMNETLIKIKEFFDQNIGSRKIAEQLKISRWAVQQAYKKLGIYNIGRTKPVQKRPIEKICKICNVLKSIFEYRERIRKGRNYYESYCLGCEKNINKESCNKRYQENKSWYKEYRRDNLAKITSYNLQYNKNHKQELIEYRRNNRDKIRSYLNTYFKQKRITNPEFKIRGLVSNSINYGLHNNKKNKSCLKVLSYSMIELKQHLEVQFESWMTWKNHGKYIVLKWDDNDQSTWTWQIDHIIPHSDLPYKSMDDDNFKKCWALKNLRPLSAKQNIIDGVRRTRHNK